MYYIIYFDIAGLIMTLFLLYSYLVFTYLPSWNNRIYVMTLVAVVGATATNIFSCFSDFWPQKFLFWKYAIDVIHLLIGNFVPVSFYIYFYSMTHKRKEFTLKSQLFMMLAAAYEVIAIISSPFTHFVMYFDDTGIYCRGPGMASLFLLSFIFVILSLCQIDRKKDWGYRQLVMVIVVYGTANILQIIIQFYNQNLMLAGFSSALSLFFGFIFIQNPLRFIDSPTGAYNSLAGELLIQEILDSEKNAAAVFIQFTGAKYRTNELRSCIQELMHLCKKRTICTIADGMFIVCCTSEKDAHAQGCKIVSYLNAGNADRSAYVFVFPGQQNIDFRIRHPVLPENLENFARGIFASYKWKSENVLITIDQGVVDICIESGLKI